MKEFKAGDLVECVNNDGQEEGLTIGKKYEVLESEEYEVFLRVKSDKKSVGGYGINRFKLANKTTKGENMNNIKKLHKDIKNIYFNEAKRTTVIVFNNGDKVKATSSKDTPFSEYAGFVTALFKYEHGFKLKDVEHLLNKKRG